MRYLDGFVIPLPKRQVDTYRRLARAAGKIFKEHGALEFVACVGDDLGLKKGMGTSFIRMAKLKRGETALFSFITYKSRAHRDRVNKRVMADPRMAEMMEGKEMPFDVKRMAYGGFKAVVEL